MRFVNKLLTFLVLLLAQTSPSFAQEELRVCTGFNPLNPIDPWKVTGAITPEILQMNCPKDHAFIAIHPPGGRRREGKYIPVQGSCCPLPKGVLSEHYVFSESKCPDNHLATGAKQEKVESEFAVGEDKYDESSWSNIRRQLIKCTRIDTDKYSLGDEIRGVSVGYESSIRDTFKPRTSRSNIPVALRYGVGRLSRTRWSVSSCIAIPWGAVLVEKRSKYCEGFIFKQVIDLESTDQRPLKTYPDCLAIDDPLSRDAKCIKDED